MIDNQNSKIRQCLRSPRRADTAASIAILLIFGVICIYHGIVSYYGYDSVVYRLVLPTDFNDPEHTLRPIQNLSDVFESQAHMYMMSDTRYFSNGRFPVHVLVQIFCGLTHSRIPFALCNALVWIALVVLSAKLMGWSWRNPRIVFWLALMLSLVYRVQFDPPMQINYSWTSFSSLLWLYVFFRCDGTGITHMSPVPRILSYTVLAIFSLLCGWGNEAVSFSVGVGMLAVYVVRRRRFNVREYTLCTGYALGCILLLLSPGLYTRAGIQPKSTWSLPFILFVLEVMAPVLMWAVTLSIFKIRGLVSLRNYFRKNIFSLSAMAASILLLVLMRVSMHGILVPANLAATFMMIELFRRSSSLRGWKITVAILGVILLVRCYVEELQNERAASRIERASLTVSPKDSIVYITKFGHFERRLIDLEQYNWLRFSKHPGSSSLILLPEEASGISLDADTNFVKKIDDYHWLVIQSKTNPAKFVVDKRIRIGTFTHELPQRVLNLNDKNDIFIYESACWRAGVYEPRSKYMEAKVRMELE